MTASLNSKFLFLILATCAAFISLGYFSPVLGLALVVLVLSLYKRESVSGGEPFADGALSDELWAVRFQDKVMFYNSPCFLRSNHKLNLVGTNCGVSDPRRVPVSFSWENFVIEDARMAYGTYRGNVNRLQYGADVHLQSQSRNNETQTYVTFADNKLQVTDKRDANTRFVLLPVADNKNMYVEFGDTLYIQHKNSGNLIAIDKYTFDSLKLTKEKNKNSEWQILNQMAYGKNIEVDWARESWASQSSLYQGSKYPASNCTDGDSSTFCHSDLDKDTKSPYFELHLPRLIDVQKVVILNRQDCCKDRLGKFFIIIYLDRIDPEQEKLVSTEVYRKENTASPSENEFVLGDINKVGNRVRVELADTGAKRILNLASVSVYGNPVTQDAANRDDVMRGDSSQFLLFKPTEVLNQMVLPISPSAGSNFGLHFQINVFESADERRLVQMEEFGINLLPGGFVGVSYMLEGGERRVLTSQSNVTTGQSSHVAVQVYNGLNEQNGWKRVRVPPDNIYVLMNAQERRYFTVYSIKSKSSYVETSVPLEQFEFIANVPEGKEEKPFIRLFLNRRLDTERSENKWITNSAKGPRAFSALLLNPFFGVIGPLRITSFYYPSNVFVNLLAYEQTVKLGNFSIEENKKVGAARLPTFSRVGFTASFWLYITTNNNLQRYCILRHGSAFHVQLDYLNNALHFNFVVLNPKTKEKTPLQLNVATNENVIPFRLNHLAAVVDNVKNVVRVYLNGEQVSSKKVAGHIDVENYKALEIGGNCGYPDLSGQLSGKILELQVSNFPQTKTMIADQVKQKWSLVEHSKVNAVNKVNALFQKIGCPATLIDEQLRNPELSQMYLSMYNRDSKALGNNFAAIKKLADEVIYSRQGDGALSAEKLEVVRLCYGEPTSNVVKRLHKINQEVFQLKEKGNVSLPLLTGHISGLSSTVIGPKMIQTQNLDNLIVTFDINIKSTMEGFAVGRNRVADKSGELAVRAGNILERHILSLKFIQGKKHAYVPQLYILPSSGRWAMDVFTSEGIETVEIPSVIPLGVTHKILIVFQKGYEVNFFVDGDLVETRQMLGRVMVSNIFEALIGPADGLGGFDGWLSNLSVSYNNLYSLKQRTRTLVKEVAALERAKKIPEQFVQNLGGKSFTLHGWVLYKSSNTSNNKCKMLQGILSNTFFKVCVSDTTVTTAAALIVTVGESSYSVKLPAFFYNQWNYLSFEFDQSGDVTVLSVYVNAKLYETIETKNVVLAGDALEEKSVLLLGECKNTFVKELKLSNYVLTNTQIIDFMNNNRTGGLIDSDQTSLFDFEKDIQTMRKELSALKSRHVGGQQGRSDEGEWDRQWDRGRDNRERGDNRGRNREDLRERTDASLKERCYVIENKWNHYKNKNLAN